MKISFVIPLYNGRALTGAMLASLQQSLPADLRHEIILVDDGSTDGTREWLCTLTEPFVALLNERNRGFASTCNRGAAIARGEFIFFLNNDLVLLPGWLEPMLAILRRSSRVGLVGNVQLNFGTGAVDHAGIFFNHRGKPEHHRGRGLFSHRKVDAVTGACFGIRREVWCHLGGFDEGYVNGCEDVDLCLRARAGGWSNHVALRSVVRHHISASSGRKVRDEQNTARLHRRWHEALVPRVLSGCCRVCLGAAWEDPRNYPDARLARDAFLYLCGLLPEATPALRSAAKALLEIERIRWTHLLEGAPSRTAREIAWQFFPITPEDPPVH